MKMYVANLTQQAWDFGYRLPEQPGVRKQRIEMGSQVRIAGELSQRDIDAIVEQYGKYGLIRVDEIDRTKAFAGVCYSIDKTVPIDKIRRGIEHNNEILVERGKEQRKEAAVATNAQIESQLPTENGAPALQALEVTIEEDKSGDFGKNAKHEEVAEGFVVSRDDNRAQARVGNRRRAPTK